MRILFIVLIFSLQIVGVFAQVFNKNQSRIPLDNIKGIPYCIANEHYSICGFEVDKKGNMYFLGGQKNAILSVFHGGKQIYRRIYKEFDADKIQLINDDNELLIFNPSKDNSLFALKISDGSIINKYNNITSENVNSHRFIDSILVID
ncbi:MAG: hypothetical protein JWP37_4369, partial [Mucilaginibacter sp.]|nr:hypothetical protein [Mucilaginibacter sp.]